ncbi:MAG TPA: cytochrome c biogenesis protein CcdA [Candidatus Bipolaricaulis sp.]|nr:cytochrome c biogenesis protein CcdA [Candidatus Bipolaricaulis sp.]HRS14507.1 cytochrome c biogenesis protein CcdA [Candidatus Bipolaricaulis sp.]HRU21325.1 cytochrome c biogenesis protein CcdA [Candidatus Bipolaricaulis sp.]
MRAVMDWKRWILVLAVWGLVGGVGLAGGATELLFFYDESCTHCKQVESFLTDLQRAGLEFTIERYEIHTPEGWNLLLRLLGAYHADIGSVPMVFVGEVAVVGNTFYGLGPEPIVYTGAAYDLVLEEAVRAAVAANAPSPRTLLPPVATEAVVIVPSDPCLDVGCVLLDLHLTQLGEVYPALGIRRLAGTDPNALSTFEKLLRLYGVRGDPPALFVGDAAVVGGNVYLPRRDPVPLSSPAGEAALREAVAKAVEAKVASPLDRLRLREQLTLGAVVVGAALDSINPCDFAVLVLLLGTLLVVGKRVKVIWAGLAFAAGIFVAYFAIGFGLYAVLGITVGSRAFRVPFILAVSSLAILVGLWEMKDLLWYGKWFSIEVPERWKPSVKRITASVVSVPGAFVIGLVDSLFLAPCTSGPYIVILTLLSQTTTRVQGALWLLLYNFIFILPMIAITLMVHFGFTTTARAERWRTAKLGTLHFAAGLVMVLLGVGMIVGVLLGYL